MRDSAKKNIFEYSQYELYWVELNPTKGSEIKKTRPCVILSPNEMNKYLNTLVIAPLTSTLREYPFRVLVEFSGKKGMIVLDQIRTVDKSRILEKFGDLKKDKIKEVKSILKQMLVE